MYSVEQMKELISNCKTKKEVMKVVKDSGYNFSDDSDEYGYFNLHCEDDVIKELGYCMFRVYQHKKEFKFQTLTKYNYVYTGIPVFFG